MTGMGAKFSKRFLMIISGVVMAVLLLAAYTFFQFKSADKNLEKLSIQLDKILSTVSLEENLVMQSYYIKGYMLYQEPFYLEQFRRYARLNQEEGQELHEIIRPARKPMVKKILELNNQYTQMCEKEIIPKVRKGAVEEAAEVAQSTGVVSLLEESLDIAEEIERLRVRDTRGLFVQTIDRVKLNIFGSFVLIALVCLGGLALGVPVAARASIENMVYRLILSTTRNAIITVKKDGSIYFINRVTEEIFGVNREKVVGRQFNKVFTGREQPGEVAFTYPVMEVMASGKRVCNDERIYAEDENWHYNLLVDCLPLKNEGEVIGAMILLRDVTEQKVVEERLMELAVRDSMTALYNHANLKQALDREVGRASDRGTQVAFMLMDIDNFKYYNDSFGHLAGDKLLKELAGLLEKSVRSSDIVGRYGGDEFAVVLPGAGQKKAAEIGERLRKAIEEHPFPYREMMPGGKITVSVGVACFPADAKSVSELVKKADEAMYTAKRSAKNKVEIYFSAFKELQADWPDAKDMLHNVGVLLSAINAKDLYTYSHSEKVARYSVNIAEAAGLGNWEIRKIKMAAFLHDLGKVEIPAEILKKPGPLMTMSGK